jgi:hypothetical protein
VNTLGRIETFTGTDPPVLAAASPKTRHPPNPMSLPARVHPSHPSHAFATLRPVCALTGIQGRDAPRPAGQGGCVLKPYRCWQEPGALAITPGGLATFACGLAPPGRLAWHAQAGAQEASLFALQKSSLPVSCTPTPACTHWAPLNLERRPFPRAVHGFCIPLAAPRRRVLARPGAHYEVHTRGFPGQDQVLGAPRQLLPPAQGLSAAPRATAGGARWPCGLPPCARPPCARPPCARPPGREGFPSRWRRAAALAPMAAHGSSWRRATTGAASAYLELCTPGSTFRCTPGIRLYPLHPHWNIHHGLEYSPASRAISGAGDGLTIHLRASFRAGASVACPLSSMIRVEDQPEVFPCFAPPERCTSVRCDGSRRISAARL